MCIKQSSFSIQNENNATELHKVTPVVDYFRCLLLTIHALEAVHFLATKAVPCLETSQCFDLVDLLSFGLPCISASRLWLKVIDHVLGRKEN